MFPSLSDASRSSTQIASAIRAYADVRAELGARDHLLSTLDVLRAGTHLWSALAEEATSPGTSIRDETQLATDVDLVAADMATLVLRAPSPAIVRAWVSSLFTVVRFLPSTSRLSLLTHAERIADALGSPDAAKTVCDLYVDAIVASASGDVPSMREGVAQLARFALASDVHRALVSDALATVVATARARWPREPDVREVLREIRAELKALAKTSADPAIERAVERSKGRGGRAAEARAELARRESDPTARELENALSAAGFPTPRGKVPRDALLIRVPWFPLDRRGWLVCFDAETGFAPHREHGALLRAVAAKLERRIRIVKDEFVAGRGWRLVFTTPERHELEARADEPDDWVNLELLHRAVQIVAGDRPVFSLSTDDQTVALLCAPTEASAMLARSGWLKHPALRAKRVGSRRRPRR